MNNKYTAMFDYQIALGTYGPWIAMAPGSARFQVSEQACAMLRDGILSSAPSERRACLVREAVSLWHQRSCHASELKWFEHVETRSQLELKRVGKKLKQGDFLEGL
jgi:hypothetical protein